MLNLFEESQKNNESWAEMKARQQKDSRVADTVAMLMVLFVIGPFLVWLIIDAMDKAAK